MDVTSIAQTALALRSAATAQQQTLAAVKQAHQADQALVQMLAEATTTTTLPTARGQHLNILV